MTIEEKLKLITWVYPKPKTGMTTNGNPDSTITLVCNEYEFLVTIGGRRSRLQNKDLAFQIFDLYLQEVYKL